VIYSTKRGPETITKSNQGEDSGETNEKKSRTRSGMGGESGRYPGLKKRLQGESQGQVRQGGAAKEKVGRGGKGGGDCRNWGEGGG